jgi:hypothetical protein
MPVYIQSVNHISAQKPLSDEWFDSPAQFLQLRVPTSDPDFAPHFPSLASRRLCRLLKRAVLLSRLTLKDANLNMPDAIITGTGLGCIENTEKFLWSIMDNGEQFLQPSFFMQSTHNIISSTVAIDLQCHGYNNTFVHRGVSFDCALSDAFTQINLGRINNALVGGYDELTDDYFIFFQKLGLWNFMFDSVCFQNNCFAGETAVCFALSDRKTDRTVCEIIDVELLYAPERSEFNDALCRLFNKAGYNPFTNPCQGAVMRGVNGNHDYDSVYEHLLEPFSALLPMLQYKHIFGESFAASAFGVYAAALCLQKNRIPAVLCSYLDENCNGVKYIIVHNYYNKTHSLILLASCSAS